MEIKQVNITSPSFKFSVVEENEEIGRGFLYLIKKELHSAPVGYMEDIFVEESHRGQGLGAEITKAIIAKARAEGCYKLIFTSRYGRDKLHSWYTKFGFEDFGKEFRMNL
jgi:GNAT superfamily N-acetyltransferase